MPARENNFSRARSQTRFSRSQSVPRDRPKANSWMNRNRFPAYNQNETYTFSRPQQTRPQATRGVVCHYCRVPGHTIDKCYKRENLYGKFVDTRRSPDVSRPFYKNNVRSTYTRRGNTQNQTAPRSQNPGNNNRNSNSDFQRAGSLRLRQAIQDREPSQQGFSRRNVGDRR